ncbi:MAG: hypothetical protein XXXJIFNMEKO3_01919 [Candidatus Erwinia impunctatus]|nr:hypothetical protein XXXJIFNMEKO_01919 [Culicoides impunctatus]
MEGLSSQRDLVQGIKLFSAQRHIPVKVFASHREARDDILSVADHALIEPALASKRLAFITETADKYNIRAIHAGKNTLWFEEQRSQIESCGISLTTGAYGSDSLNIADDKVCFAELMQQHQLPVVPSLRITSLDALEQALSVPAFGDRPLCIKPVTGIYGNGFWRLDKTASLQTLINQPERRLVTPQFYLQAAASQPSFSPLVLMPYLPGPEYSVDILVSGGTVLAAVARRKVGALQYIENEGPAWQLACDCARLLKADGLINVQTRHDEEGNPLLLEANLRPSGGIGYTLHSGINLAGLYAFHKLALMTSDEVRHYAAKHFVAATVKPIVSAIAYHEK